MLEILQVNAKSAPQWDEFVADSFNGIFFHTQRFLSYHAERFGNHERHLAWMKGREIFAVMSLGFFEEKGSIVAKSPYGSSYGGIVFKRPPSYFEAKKTIQLLINFLKQAEVSKLSVTPTIDYDCSTDIVAFVLLSLGAKMVNADANSIVSLGSGTNSIESVMRSSGRRCARKAERFGVKVIHKSSDVEGFFSVRNATFAKFSSPPSHTDEEWLRLLEIAPESVEFDLAYIDDTPVAAIGKFILNKTTICAFYILQNPEYQASQALSLLFRASMENAKSRNFLHFDLGTSSVAMNPRENLFRFKESLGAKTLLRRTFELQL